MALRSSRSTSFSTRFLPGPFRRTTLAWSLAFGTTLALTACGGGGGDDPVTSDVAPSGNVSAASYLPLRTNVVDASGNFQAQRLLLIDPVSAQVAWQREVSTGSAQQAVRAFTMSANGLTLTQGAHTAWYFTDQGKLYGVDARSAAPSPVQISSESAVCDLQRAVPTEPGASLSWLLLRTGGADGLCDTPDDNQSKLVRSDASASTAALAWAGGDLEPLDVHRDVAGKLTQLLAYDSSKQQLIVVSAADGAVTPVVGGQLAAGSNVGWYGRAAGRRDQVYVAVLADSSGELRTLTWGDDNAAPTLGTSSLVPIKVATPVFAHTDDASGFYFVDDGVVYAIDKGAATARKLHTLASINEPSSSLKRAAPVFAGGAMTTHTLVLPVLDPTGSRLYVINKDTGTLRTLSVPNDGEAPYTVEAHQGDQIVISRAADVGSLVKPLWRADVSGTSSLIPVTAVSASAHVIAAPRSDVEALGGEVEQAAAVWCEAAVACTSATVQSLQLASGSNLALGAAGAGGPSWVDQTAGSSLGSRAGFSVSSQSGVVWLSDSAWLLDATVAGSLKQVVLP
jgi:hypothetical protein